MYIFFHCYLLPHNFYIIFKYEKAVVNYYILRIVPIFNGIHLMINAFTLHFIYILYYIIVLGIIINEDEKK